MRYTDYTGDDRGLLQRVIDFAYNEGVITDSQADSLESRFVGDWVEQ